MDLSVLIPARREMWLKRTIEDVLAHAEADTEVIAVVDGEWPLEPLPQHPRVTVIRVPQSIGQRAATNRAARVSRATYVMKRDAHCSLAQGFDRELIAAAETLGPNVTQVPTQHNLHVFDWVCESCGVRTYQGPTPVHCGACGGAAHRRDIVWRRRESRRTTAWRFDATLHFQYWRAYQAQQQGDTPDTMSCLGACWFLERARYWQLGGMDEGHGSWGGMGTEVACKSWLSGGRLVTNRRTWFSHLFRTQGGDFGFPYPMTGSEQERARAYSRRLWLENRWPGQTRPLSWLIQHFSPVPDWPAPRTAGIVYYTENRLDPVIAGSVRAQLTRAAGDKPIVSVSLQPIDFGRNIVLNEAPGVLTMFRQILAGLEALDTDDAFLCEHDVLYAPQHFWFEPPARDRYYYNLAVWKVDAESGRAVTYETKQTSGLCADRQLLIAHYRRRIARVEAEGFSRRMGFEPGSHQRPERVDDVQAETWCATVPNIDLRHGRNLTPSRWSPEAFRSARNCRGWQESTAVPGWGPTVGRMADLLKGQTHG